MELINYNVKNVPKKTRNGISKYCKEKGITQAKYLSDDKRLKEYL